jgi:ABC-2 type transport system ATP-binding protein
MTIAAPPRLEIDGLRKRYGAHQALAGLSLRVDAGEIVGLLGPNGAGKTTTIESLAGLIQPDEGHMLLDGAPLAVAHRARIGIALQNMALQDKATPAEALRLFASLYDARPNIDALTERAGQSVLRVTFRRPETAARACTGLPQRSRAHPA